MKRGIVFLFTLIITNIAPTTAQQSSNDRSVIPWIDGGIHSDLLFASPHPAIGIQLSENLSIDQKYYLMIKESYGVDFSGKTDVIKKKSELTFLSGISIFGTGGGSLVCYSGITLGRAVYRGALIRIHSNSSFGPDTREFEYDDYDYFAWPVEIKLMAQTFNRAIGLSFYTSIYKYSNYGFALCMPLNQYYNK